MDEFICAEHLRNLFHTYFINSTTDLTRHPHEFELFLVADCEMSEHGQTTHLHFSVHHTHHVIITTSSSTTLTKRNRRKKKKKRKHKHYNKHFWRRLRRTTKRLHIKCHTMCFISCKYLSKSMSKLMLLRKLSVTVRHLLMPYVPPFANDNMCYIKDDKPKVVRTNKMHYYHNNKLIKAL